MTAAAPVVALDAVTKTYDGAGSPNQVLKGVSLHIAAGEYVAVIGSSGSGKSTLMNVLGCLDVPTTGSYRLFGTDVAGLSRAALADLRNARIGFVFQSFQLLPRLSAFENVELPMIYAGVSAKERRARVLGLLEVVGLTGKHDRRPSQLSGGEQQRVAICRALAMEPDVILADEPTGNLDAATGIEILKVFDDLHEVGQTVVLVTHDPTVARRARRNVEIKDGLILRDGPPEGAAA